MWGRCPKSHLKFATFDVFDQKLANFTKSPREDHKLDPDEQDGKSLVFWRTLDRHISQRARMDIGNPKLGSEVAILSAEAGVK